MKRKLRKEGKLGKRLLFIRRTSLTANRFALLLVACKRHSDATPASSIAVSISAPGIKKSQALRLEQIGVRANRGQA